MKTSDLHPRIPKDAFGDAGLKGLEFRACALISFKTSLKQNTKQNTQMIVKIIIKKFK